MEKQASPSIAARRLGPKDIFVLLLIAIIFFLAGWIIQSDRTKYVVVVVKERVEKEVDLYQAKTKEKIGQFLIKKTGI